MLPHAFQVAAEEAVDFRLAAPRLHVLRIARRIAVGEPLGENLIKHGITFEQVRVMRFLDSYSSDNPANQKDVEIMFELKRSSVTNILQNMEKNGLVTRSGDALDGRMKKVWLTEKGKDLYLHLRSYLVKLEEVIVQGMTEEEKDMFRLLLKKSIQNVETFMK